MLNFTLKENHRAYKLYSHGDSLERKGERFRPMAKRMLMTTAAPGSQKRRSPLPRRKPRAVPGQGRQGACAIESRAASFDLRAKDPFYQTSNSPRASPVPSAIFSLDTPRAEWIPHHSIHHPVVPFLVAIRPVAGGNRTDSPRNNNPRARPGRACNQRSLMAPHYTKRRAKGAWHFLSRRTKNQERPAASCGCAHFLLALIGGRDAAAGHRRRRRRRRLLRRWPMTSDATGRLTATRCAARRYSRHNCASGS